MFPTLPPSISSLICFFLLATPLLCVATPVPDANAPAVAGVVAKAAKPAPVAPAKRATPTRRMGQRKVKKAEPLKKKDYSSFLCPGGAVACPVYSGEDVTIESVAALESSLTSLADWFKLGFECMELDSELNSCGGCLALGAGQDCAQIANARATGCESGVCAVYSCFDGYVVGPDRKSCVKKGTVTPPTPITAMTATAGQIHLG